MNITRVNLRTLLLNEGSRVALMCSMADDTPAAASGLNTPNQPALSSEGGNVKSLGGVTRVVAGQDPVDASALGSAAAEDNIDPTTGKPKEATRKSRRRKHPRPRTPMAPTRRPNRSPPRRKRRTRSRPKLTRCRKVPRRA